MSGAAAEHPSAEGRADSLVDNLVDNLAKRIIPCLDVRAGRVVKGVQFVNLKDAGDPVEVAKRYDQQGADEIAFLDITASADNRATMASWVAQVANHVFIPLTVGGGIRQLPDIHALLQVGADRVCINTSAVQQPEFIQQASRHFGNQCIVVAVDAKQSVSGTQPRWEIFTHGGRRPTGLDAVDWAKKMAEYGAGELLVTSMDRDGTKHGFDLALLQRITQAVDVPVIASGGVGQLSHLSAGILQGGADAVLAASIFHYGEFTIQHAKQQMAADGISVRL